MPASLQAAKKRVLERLNANGYKLSIESENDALKAENIILRNSLEYIASGKNHNVDSQYVAQQALADVAEQKTCHNQTNKNGITLNNIKKEPADKLYASLIEISKGNFSQLKDGREII